MAFQSVPLTAEAFVQYDLQGVTVGNTFYFRKSGGYTQSDLEDLAADIDSWVHTEWKGRFSNQCLYVKTVVRGLENEEDYVVENNTNSGYGTNAANPLPAQVAFAVQRISGLTGRSARGRIFVTGLSLNQVDTNENHLTVATIVNILTALLEIASYVVTHGWIEVIVSRYHNSVKRLEAETMAVSDWTFTDATFDTQRRRLV